MARARSNTDLAGQLGTLYSLGTVGSLQDDQLVERFLARNDPAASEAAFAALVERHGAMVLCVCQRVLGNPHDAARRLSGDVPGPGAQGRARSGAASRSAAGCSASRGGSPPGRGLKPLDADARLERLHDRTDEPGLPERRFRRPANLSRTIAL